MVSAEGHPYEHALKFMFKMYNNEAKYDTLLVRIEICNALGAGYLKALFDSQLVMSQVRGEYEACNTAMVAYLASVKERSSMFKTIEIEHVPKLQSRQVNTRSKLTNSFLEGYPKSIHWEILSERMINAKELVWIDNGWSPS